MNPDKLCSETNLAVNKVTISVPNPSISAEFCIRVLGAKNVPVTADLAKHGIRWVVFNYTTEFHLHFVPIFPNLPLAQAAMDMSHAITYGFREFVTTGRWNNILDTHFGLHYPFSLNLIIDKMKSEGVAHSKPVRRADGTFQMYFEVPYGIIGEFDSSIYHGEYTTWDNLYGSNSSG